ncbi:alpha/beta fold hydrolase [Solirubrobacter deserti]|uniref:Alpha/beta hydrolase n=1 Tax=Solirubrobacter deserti TaxID=2282478 RepID=A0ABT4RPA4_9ACTN|nr:alpha/beta hydrolase [Solirubrobacter deserti]MDA0140394.1 alpha/beta hydrolase [Solirubrobacter deserti]
MEPTIVLVHGAFAESASWDGVVDALLDSGHPVIAVANPLRGLAADATAVSDVVSGVVGPVILVGHSYGGAVITNVADVGDVIGLVYVAGFAPAPGESCFTLAGEYPGSTLGDALEMTRRSDGTTDLRITADRFHAQFAADVPEAQAARMAVTQRPVTQEALLEPSGERPLWKTCPSWFIFGEEDRNIPAAAMHHMAERARAHRTVEIPGASHAISVAHPLATAHMIREAAALRVVAS